ncbi:MAG: NnrS family protein [Gammaproteobacteria bacterium]
MTSAPSSFLSFAFRPFFLCNGLFAVGIISLWILKLHGLNTFGMGSSDPLWHAHEMLFGFVMAAIAGFSLTAVSTWTGREPVQGVILGWLLGLWLLGRIAMLWATSLPVWLPLTLDLLFPAGLALVFAREVIAGGSRRNLPLVAIMLLLTVFNLSYHLGRADGSSEMQSLSLYLALHTVLLLVAVVAGRIVPSFTANWLRARGKEKLPRTVRVLELLVVVATIATGIAASVAASPGITGLLALVAAILHGLRLAQWQGWATTSEPLLFVLHVAYGWFPLGYGLLALSAFNPGLPSTAAVHALAMGVIGSMILAVTTRVALGHTGRPLQAARLTVAAYCLFTFAVAARVIGPITGAAYMSWIDMAGTAWIASFALFCWVYWPILTKPKISS